MGSGSNQEEELLSAALQSWDWGWVQGLGPWGFGVLLSSACLWKPEKERGLEFRALLSRTSPPGVWATRLLAPRFGIPQHPAQNLDLDIASGKNQRTKDKGPPSCSCRPSTAKSHSKGAGSLVSVMAPEVGAPLSGP